MISPSLHEVISSNSNNQNSVLTPEIGHTITTLSHGFTSHLVQFMYIYIITSQATKIQLLLTQEK